jgi:AAA15 family ATPase/GTPase
MTVIKEFALIKLKTLRVKNYCGYRDMTFNFGDEKGITPLNLFFGANGSGKSSILRAISLLGNAHQFQNREVDLLFRKLIFSKDYDPTYQLLKEKEGLVKTRYDMEITGVFDHDGEEKVVQVNNGGVVVNELPRQLTGHSYFIDADHPMNMRRFQLCNEYRDDFLHIAKIIYDLDCDFDDDKVAYDGDKCFYTDFIIDKIDDFGELSKVHFKSMSDGERKIATLLASLFNPTYMENTNVILVDNIEMHVYWKRHDKMIDEILRLFPDHQIFATTHSGTMIKHVESKYGKSHLFDLQELKAIKS